MVVAAYFDLSEKLETSQFLTGETNYNVPNHGLLNY